MSDPTKGWKVQVNPDLPGDPKLLRLAKMIKDGAAKIDRLEEIVALGLVMRLWCFTMRREDTGTLSGWAPEDIAAECGWTGDVKPETFINAMLNCGRNSIRKDGKGFLTQTGPDYEVYKWCEWQNDPAGTRKKWRDYRAQKREGRKQEAEAKKAPPAGDNTVVKVLLDRMREAHITGGAAQKREHAEAWHAAGIAQKAEQLIMGAGKSKDIFWLSKALNGTPFASASSDSVDAIHKKFLGTEGGK